MQKCLFTFSALVLLAAGPQNCFANLLLNGGFEDDVLTTSYFENFVAGGPTSINGWTVGQNGNVDIINASLQASGSIHAAIEASQYLDLAGWENGSISQTFATVIGEAYQLSFSFNSNNDSAPFVDNANVRVAGTSTLLDADIFHNDGAGWMTVTWDFVADSTSSTLIFTSTNAESTPGGISLDSISVVAVPEPSTLALTMLALPALVAVRRRKSV